MLTRVREDGDGYKVTVFDATRVIEARDTKDLVEAFAMQKAVQDSGKWPDGKEPGK